MGIPVQVIKAFVAEAKIRAESRRTTQKIALFGKQTVHATSRLLEEEFNLTADAVCIDRTRHARIDQNGNVTDIELLNAIFPGAKVDVFDRSDYEGANILVDLNRPLPEHYYEDYDVVYTGGCLDNVFNPVAVLLNSTKLLKEHGSVLHYESAANLIGAFQYFSQEWFYSYYAVNRFQDCQVFLLNHHSPGKTRFRYHTDIYRYTPYFTRAKDFDYLKSACSLNGVYYNMVIAQRGPLSTSDNLPIQMQYIDNDCIDWRSMEESYCCSPRIRAITEMARVGQCAGRPFLSDHYTPYGTNF